MKHNQNWLLWRNLIYSLILFGRIKTTKTRAKAIIGLVDKLVNKIKKGTVAGKREVLQTLPRKEVVIKLTKEIVPVLAGKNSGYTRITKIGSRQGDGAKMVIMEWIKEKVTQVVQVEKIEQVEKVSKVPKARKKENAKNDQAK